VISLQSYFIFTVRLPKLSPNTNILGVSKQYLPAYSPELNPCELVFAVVKNGLIRSGVECLFEDMIAGFESVTIETDDQFYRMCIYPEQILLELAIEL
jgi:hypothetical protein